jgi:hypothetical protein
MPTENAFTLDGKVRSITKRTEYGPMKDTMSGDSLVSNVTDYEIFLFAATSRLVLGP